MSTMAKGEMLIDIRSGQVKHIRIRENRGISIGCAVPHNHLLILSNALPGHFGVFYSRAPHVHYRRYHPQCFMTHAFNE